MVQQTGWLLFAEDPLTDYIRFVFFSTLCSYSFHYYFTTHSVIPSPRISWMQQNRRVLLLFFVTGLAGSLFFFFRLYAFRYWLLPAVLATFLYSAPKIPHPLFHQLRKVAIGKTIFLAFIWMYVTAVLPVIVSGKEWNNGFSIFAASRFFFIYCICILFDYRDRQDDKANGVRSLITFLEEKSITRLFLFSLLVYTVLTFILLQYGLHYRDLIFLLVPGGLLAALYNYARRHFSDLLYYVVLDGLMAFSALLMLVGRI